MVSGMTALSAPLNLTLITTAQMQTNLTAFITQDSGYNAQRSVRQGASDAFQAQMATVYNWLLGVSNTLATAWGTRWSTQWAQAGFINNSTGIPPKTEDRLGLVLSLVNFFTANPGYEVPSQNQTAAYGTTLRTAALAAQMALAAEDATLKAIADAWTAAYDTLVKGMKDLIRNLESVLADNDPRWVNFGLQIPSTITTPGQPVNVAAHLDQTGAIIVQCAAVPLASRYRWRTMLVGQQTAYLLGASTPAPLGSLGGFLPGQTVQIIVQAVNGALQGVASEPVQFTMPVLNAAKAEKPAPAKAKAAEEKPVAKKEVANGDGHGHRNGNGNGNGNGHLAVSRMG